MKGNTLWVITGPPFSGKGELMKALRKHLYAGFIGIGDICREEAKNNTEAYRVAVEYMSKSGSTLWPTEILRQEVWKRFETLPHGIQHVFADGFLRTPDQVEETVSLATTFGFASVGIIHVITSDKTCYEREAGRIREDDKPLALRLQDYHNLTVPAMYQFLSLAVGHNYFRVPICGEDMKFKARWYAEGLHHLHGVKWLSDTHPNPG